LGKQFQRLEAAHIAFIQTQKFFFNASAAPVGRVNVSPRDAKSMRILDPNTAIYLDLTGSGNETAAHIRADGRLTFMFCSFEGSPMILRLYGRGRVIRRGCPEYESLLKVYFGGCETLGARQMIQLTIDQVQTSCGYNVPLFEYAGDRETLLRWAEAKGTEGLKRYWSEKNTRSIDGFPTGLVEDSGAPESF